MLSRFFNFKRNVRNSIGTKFTALSRLKKLGLNPKTVFDVGASVGTYEIYNVFPESHHFLIEPLEENASYLAQVCKALPSAEFLIAAASNRTGSGTLQVREDLTYSTLVENASFSDPRMKVREIATVTLDDLCQRSGLKGPFVFKIDVDGKELEVLEGARKTLEATDCVIVEVSFFREDFQRIMKELWQKGFELYEVVDPLFRPFDGSLFNLDLVFVRSDSPFRAYRGYFGPQSDPYGAVPQTWRDETIRCFTRKGKWWRGRGKWTKNLHQL
jgi:FkbM family methyltransferase